MRTTSKFLFALIILSLSAIGYSQNPVAILNYMKVEPGNSGDFLELEKEFKVIHQARLDQGIITSWALYKKMYAGAADPYQYIVVAIFDDFKKTEKPIPWDWIKENYSEQERKNMMERAHKARTIVRTEIYKYTTGAENSLGSNYFFINRMKAKPGKVGAYADFEKEMVKPVFEEAIRMGARSGWHCWRRWLGDDEFHFVTVDGYSEYGQWDEHEGVNGEALKKVFPDKDMNELYGKTGELRTRVSRELWKLVDVMPAQEE